MSEPTTPPFRITRSTPIDVPLSQHEINEAVAALYSIAIALRIAMNPDAPDVEREARQFVASLMPEGHPLRRVIESI